MLKRHVVDTETDGYNPSRIWCVCVCDIDTMEVRSFYGDNLAEGLIVATQADIIVGHNLKGYDVKHIERLTEGLVSFDRNKLDDTLEMSKLLFPEMRSHSLETWGEILGYPKIHFKDFGRFSMEMVRYCEQDVRLNAVLYKFFLQYIDEQEDIRMKLTE